VTIPILQRQESKPDQTIKDSQNYSRAECAPWTYRVTAHYGAPQAVPTEKSVRVAAVDVAADDPRDWLPERSEGGRAGVLVGHRSVYIGNVAHWTTALSARDWSGIARTAYQQLMAYHRGWQTDWTPTCDGTRLGHEPFITAPRLFAWEDVDGDGVPEIIDDTPYGRSR